MSTLSPFVSDRSLIVDEVQCTSGIEHVVNIVDSYTHKHARELARTHPLARTHTNTRLRLELQTCSSN